MQTFYNIRDGSYSWIHCAFNPLGPLAAPTQRIRERVGRVLTSARGRVIAHTDGGATSRRTAFMLMPAGARPNYLRKRATSARRAKTPAELASFRARAIDRAREKLPGARLGM
ncbi:hypothetical protein EVAR_71187_1 [Eumeta japonica]|uniref:Uncharacterized protein n=1 Tax=Eumeta variegata TaxID=151549 RepID=A0A4C2A9K2_EUMVA|nr:hypothetical protein EVAR_71187_1 [Eumeta japonica]